MGPLEVWVGEVSDRTWRLSWRLAVSSQTGGVLGSGRLGEGAVVPPWSPSSCCAPWATCGGC